MFNVQWQISNAYKDESTLIRCVYEPFFLLDWHDEPRMFNPVVHMVTWIQEDMPTHPLSRQFFTITTKYRVLGAEATHTYVQSFWLTMCNDLHTMREHATTRPSRWCNKIVRRYLTSYVYVQNIVVILFPEIPFCKNVIYCI